MSSKYGIRSFFRNLERMFYEYRLDYACIFILKVVSIFSILFWTIAGVIGSPIFHDTLVYQGIFSLGLSMIAIFIISFSSLFCPWLIIKYLVSLLDFEEDEEVSCFNERAC